MAAATGQRFSNGSLNGASQQFHLHGQANSRKYPGAHHHHLMHGLLGGDDDDTDGATEQFPPFDPTHDGSEEDENMITGNSSDDEYRHFSTTTTATRRAVNGNGVGESLGVEQEAGGKEGSYGDAQHLQQHDGGKLVVEEDEQEEEEQSHTPMSNVDPVPEVEPNHDAKHNDQPQLHNDDASSNTQTSTTMLSPVTSPPYWAINHAEPLNLGPSASSSHDPFNHSNHSAESLIPGAITLQDNEAEEDEASQNAVGDYHGRHGEPQRQRTEGETRTSYGRDRNKACWAKSVEVTNYVIVNGSATNIGAFVVWNIRVQTLSVSRLCSPFLHPLLGSGIGACELELRLTTSKTFRDPI